jgi:hypothetical protein
LFGFDVIIDENLKPWLLEVNVAPSLSGGSSLDRVIKTSLITDTLNLIGFIPYDRVKNEQIYSKTRIKRLLGKAKSEKPVRRTAHSINRGALKLSQDEATMLAEVEDENYRRGYFTRLFPQSENVRYYEQFFENVRVNNAVLWRWLELGKGSLEPYYQRRGDAYNV